MFEKKRRLPGEKRWVGASISFDLRKQGFLTVVEVNADSHQRKHTLEGVVSNPSVLDEERVTITLPVHGKGWYPVDDKKNR